MSYGTIAQCANDSELQARIQACFVQEGGDYQQMPGQLYWDVATASDVEAAYASALAANNEHPGGDEGVITDGMILANVQAHMP